MKKIALMSLVASSVLMAGGYKIPETSTNSVSLSGANVANVNSADAAYDNPANMVFMENTNYMEADVMYIGTSATKYTPTTGTAISAEEQSFIIPSLHYVSPVLGSNGARVGLSIVVPGGLTREWKDQPAQASAEEFTLRVIEINPTAAFQVSEKVGVAVGFRMVHSEGIVKAKPNGGVSSQEMTGDSMDYGYNLALAYHPSNDMKVGLTYRSKINLTLAGSADLIFSPAHALNNTYDVSVTVPLPAALNVALAYTLATKTTVEFVYEKTYWSAYSNLDFDYTNATVEGTAFGQVKAKNWEDTNTYRLGLTQELNTLTLMAGVAYDETPTPEATLGFESPGSNSVAVSLGARYEISKSLDAGLGVLYSMKEDRKVKNANIDGEFTNSNVLMISAGLGYKF